MNNLALALIQGGVWQKQPKSSSVEEEEEESTDKEISTQKGLYFRQFMPVSAAVSVIFMCFFFFIYTIFFILRLNTI